MKISHIFLALLAILAWTTSFAGSSPVEIQNPKSKIQNPTAQAKISITARGGYGDDGSYLIGKWFPVHVTLTNPPGGTSRRVRLEVDSQSDSANFVTGTYVREVDMPAPSRKEITLYATAANFARSIDIRLMAGSTQIDKATARLDPLEQATSIIIGVVSPDPALLNVLKGERFGHLENNLTQTGYPGYLPTPPPATGSSSGSPARAAVAHMSLEEIPTISEALDGLGALVLDDIDTGSLQVEQQQALADWVARGGTLITTVKPGGEGVLAGLSEISAVQLSGTQNLSGVDSLADWVSVPLTATGSTLVPSATVKEEARSIARVPVSQGGVPLVAIREVGDGQVIYMAMSPGVAPLKNWDGLLPLFRRLLVEHKLRIGELASSLPGYYGYQSKVFDTYGSVFDLPGLDLPSPTLIGLFLFIYIAVVGPVNFIILRRMKRTELAWATIPALVVLFSIVAYLLAFQSKGGDLVALRANVVETGTGLARGTATQYLGLFSPTRGTYRLEGGAPALVSEFNAYGYSFGGPSNASPLRFTSEGNTVVEDVKINTWSLRGLKSTSMIDAPSPLLADLHVGDNIIEGTLRNQGTYPLQDVTLIRGDALQHFTSIAPGQSVDVKLKISSRPFNYDSPTVMMPPPPGVSDPSSQGGGFGYNNSSDSDAQRIYNRKVEVLNLALSSALSADPPSSPDVLAVMWGPPLSGNTLDVANATVRNDDLNLWLSRLAVGAQNDPGSQARMSVVMVPFTIYAPGNEADWTGRPPGNITLKPYADITYHLPPGTLPSSLAFSYQSTGFTGEIEVLAHNVDTGRWDRVGILENTANPSGGQTTATLGLPNPGAYTGQAGEVTLRLSSRSGEQSGSLSTTDLILNGGQ